MLFKNIYSDINNNSCKIYLSGYFYHKFIENCNKIS